VYHFYISKNHITENLLTIAFTAPFSTVWRCHRTDYSKARSI